MRRTSAPTLAIGAGVVLVAVAVVLSLVVVASARPVVRLSAATDPVVLQSTTGDRILLDADHLGPGDSVTGGIGVRNAGTATGHLVVRQTTVVDHPGPGGGRLSRVLVLRVDAGGRTLHRGPLSDTGTVDLGDLKPGATRRLSLTASFPEPTSGDDNRFEAARASASFRFVATAESGVLGEQAKGTVPSHGVTPSPETTRPGGSGVAGVGASRGPVGSLPFTGLPALALGLSGLALIGLGLLLRRRVGARL